MDRKIIDIAGNVYNRLTVISYAGKNKNNQSLWNCICECGTEKITVGYALKSGNTKSCGCYDIEKVRERFTKHGHNRGKGKTSSEYRSWQGMKERCTNPNLKQYSDYGGRGITVCDRWLNSFENFLEDMGMKPSKNHSIDRIDNNLGYSKENCRWATRTEQANNRRERSNSRYLTCNGITKPMPYWVKEWGISENVLRYNISKNRSMIWVFENKVKLGII
jgi:hypothetical protein